MFDKDITILIVDDFLTMRKLVERSLKSLGFKNFVKAQDGQVAWEILQNREVGLVISDWNMPNMTGIEFLRLVRNHETLNTTPFIMVTAESEGSQIQEALKLKVDNYVIKPFSSESLRDKISETFHKVSRQKSA